MSLPVRATKKQIELDSDTKSVSTYSYSCAMLNLNDENAHVIKYWAKAMIPSDCLYIDESDNIKGLETIPHITVKYGIVSEKPDDVAKLVYGAGSVEIKLGIISKFESDTHDVLKIEVHSNKLMKLNEAISKNIECHDTFPTYIPHCTLAYVKKGSCDNLLDNDFFSKMDDRIDQIYFTSKNGKEYWLDL